MTRLQAVSEREVPDDEAAKRAADNIVRAQQMQDAATKMLMTAIRALSQRFVVALSSLFTLVTAASAFYLWMTALPTIDTTKIVALSIYSVFILALNFFGSRK